MAGHMQAIGGQNQRESVRDADGAGHVKRRSGVRQIANDAVDCAAAELDRSGLQYAMSRRGPGFAHDGLNPLFAARVFEHMSVQPFRIIEQSAKRQGNLPVLIPLKSGRE
jgi:hypothetical protein